jgi:hypothetical protein
MDICCECYVLSGRSLCDELITRPEESYRRDASLCVIKIPQEWGGHGPIWVAAPQKTNKQNLPEWPYWERSWQKHNGLPIPHWSGGAHGSKLHSVVIAATNGTMNGLPAGYAHFIRATQSILGDKATQK